MQDESRALPFDLMKETLIRRDTGLLRVENGKVE
jgi:hypothetical protein